MKLIALLLLSCVAAFGQFNLSDPAFVGQQVSASGSTLTSGLVASFKLDESSGNATDSVGGIVLTNVGTATFTTGKINNGANFVAASSQYLNGGTNQAINFVTNAVSVSAWFKPASSASSAIVSCWESGSQGWLLDYNGSTPRFIVHNGTQVVLAGSFGTLTVGTWYYICGTFDGSTIKLSVNAGAQDSIAQAGSMAGPLVRPFQIGARNSGQFCNGMVDEVHIWSRAITTTEITADYNSGTGIQLP